MSTLPQLLTQAQAYANAKSDLPAQDVHALVYDLRMHLCTPQQTDPLPLNEWALRQVCQRLKVPFKYLSRCPTALRAFNLNHWQQQLPTGKQWLLRVYAGHIRAVLSTEYAIVNHTTVLQLLCELLDGVAIELVRPYNGVDKLQLRITTHQTEGDRYRIGCYVGNDEVGGGSLVIAPFIQRTVCTNSIIYVEGGCRRAHYRLDTNFVQVLLQHEISQALELSSDLLPAIVQAEKDPLPDLATVVADIAKRKGLNQQTQAAILMGTEAAQTRMGLVNGLSYAAHATPHLPPDTQVGLEMLAGAILSTRQSVSKAVNHHLRPAPLDRSTHRMASVMPIQSDPHLTIFA